MKLLIVTLLVLAAVSLVYSRDRNNKPRKVICYYSSWAEKSEGENRFTPEDINAHICTHINIAFATIVNNTIQFNDHNGIIGRVNALRAKNPHLSTLISLGGGNDGCTKYSEMVQSEANRKTFVQSVVEFLKAHDLDGLDFDWEFPSYAGTSAADRHEGRFEDKQDFVTVLRELHEAFKPHGYLLSAALTADTWIVFLAYDIPNVSKYLDFLNIMTYDFSGPWTNKTGHNSPLYPNPHDSEDVRQLTGQFMVDYFIKQGTDPKKIIFGIPLYGYGWQLASAGDHRIGASSSRGIELGTYAHICKLIKEPGWKLLWDDYAQVPYGYKGSEFITYDNLKSVEKKLEFILGHHLGGGFVWTVNGDDSHGHCGDGKFPMMKLMMKQLNQVQVHD